MLTSYKKNNKKKANYKTEFLIISILKDKIDKNIFEKNHNKNSKKKKKKKQNTVDYNHNAMSV